MSHANNAPKYFRVATAAHVALEVIEGLLPDARRPQAMSRMVRIIRRPANYQEARVVERALDRALRKRAATWLDSMARNESLSLNDVMALVKALDLIRSSAMAITQEDEPIPAGIEKLASEHDGGPE